jgi:hypothetical protein
MIAALALAVALKYPTYGNTTTLGSCTIAAAADLVELETHKVPSYPSVMFAYYDLVQGAPGVSGGVLPSALFTLWSTSGFAGTKLQSDTQASVAVGSKHLLLEVNLRSTQGMSIGDVNHGGRYWDWSIKGGHGQVASQHVLVLEHAYRWGLKVISYGEIEYMTWSYWRQFGVIAWKVDFK